MLAVELLLVVHLQLNLDLVIRRAGTAAKDKGDQDEGTLHSSAQSGHLPVHVGATPALANDPDPMPQVELKLLT